MKFTIVALCAIGILGCSGQDDSPDREQIPVLKQRLYQLQTAIAAKNTAALDSLMSVDILQEKQGHDSLLTFVYGPSQEHRFARLGNYEIYYSLDKARIDCELLDSTATRGRPMTLTYVFQDSLWLLKRFEPGLPKAVQ